MADRDSMGGLAAQDGYDPMLLPPNAQLDPRFAQYLGISHLLDPATYGDLPPPSVTPNAEGKVPQSDQRVLGGLADLTNVAQNFVPMGGAVGAAKAAIPIIGGLARREAPVVAEDVAKGIRAYHSSPYDFDRFDMSKIGTGEGAQVYGHGLYFAENPAVSGQGGGYWKQFQSRFSGPEAAAAEKLQQYGFDRLAAINKVKEQLDRTNRLLRVSNDTGISDLSSLNAARAADLQAQFDLLKSGKPVGPRTYEVNIAARPEQFLDWDKPLNQQPSIVQDALAKRVSTLKARGDVLLPDYMKQVESGTLPGSSIYSGLGAGSQESSTIRAAEAGIPGIRYLDQGSRFKATDDALQARLAANQIALDSARKRGAADDVAVLEERVRHLQDQLKTPPTSNYVVFNPDLITILRKYGMAGMVPAGVMGGLAAQDNYQQQ